ncbi:type IV secretion system protein [Chromobacterium vaccinii]|uniref:type IV secretion system protein n=1 Tax=Chromobacterium vaccinii TaxID=1108595 RepID=UPI003C71FAD9
MLKKIRPPSNNVKLGLMFMMAVVALSFASPVVAGGLEQIGKDFATQATAIGQALLPKATKVFGALFMIQWFLKHWKSAFTGEIPTMLAKSVGAILWGSFCLWILASPFDPINTIFNFFASATGSGFTINPDDIFDQGVNTTHNMLGTFAQGIGITQDSDTLDKIGALAKNFLPAMIIAFCAILTFLCFVFMAVAALMVKAELAMVLACAPITFMFMGLDATRETGVAPLKSALALGYRALIIGVIAGVGTGLAPKWAADFVNVSADNFDPLWTATGGAIVLVALTFQAGRIAAALASGSAALTGTDGLMGAMQAANTAANITGAMAGMTKAMTGLTKMLGSASATGAGAAAGLLGGAAAEGLAGMRGGHMNNASSMSAMNSPAAHKMASDILSGMNETKGWAPGTDASSGGGGAGADSQPSPNNSGNNAEPRADVTRDGRPAAPQLPEAATASAASTASADSNSGSNTQMGNGSSAGIGENNSPSSADSNSDTKPSGNTDNYQKKKKKGIGDHLSDSAEKLQNFSHHQTEAGDQAQVAVSINAHQSGSE